MSIKRTIISTIVVLALVAVVAPVVASATTVSDLMAEIAQLQAQLNGLQTGTTTTTTNSNSGTTLPAACVGVTFSRNLLVGSTGSDVKCLQTLLNTSSSTQVATTGAGSPGNETTYFGVRTLAAVRVYQANNGFTPANQVGPLTRAKLNAALGSMTTTGTTLPSGCTSTSGYSSTTGASCSTGVVTTVTPTGAGLTVQLASDNPASGTVVAGQALAALAKIVFVNGDNAPVTVTNVQLQRIGISADADLANVYLFQGANRLTDAASVSNGMINFNVPQGIFTVPSGSSVEITVYTDISSSATAGETIGTAVESTTNVVSNASSVHGTFPITGNLMTVATASLGSFAFSTSSANPSGTPTIQPALNTVVWEENAQVGTRALTLQWMRFRDIGSANYSAFQNFKLYINGVQAGNAVQSLDQNGYVTFDLTSAPVTLQTGSPDIKVMADIIGGSDRTFQFSVYTAADVRVVDSQYGVNVLAQNVNDASTGTVTIASGAVSVQLTTTSPSGNIVYNASNMDIADYTLTASGEPVKITSLNVAAVCPADASSALVDSTGAVSGLRNGSLYANGVQIGSTSTLNCAVTSGVTAGTAGGTTGFTTYQLGSSLIVNPGTPVTLEVRADIYSTGSGQFSSSGNGTITAELLGVTSGTNAQGQTSSQTLAVPTANTTLQANQLTVTTGGTLTLSKYTAYTNQTIAAPQTKYALGEFTLTGSTSEGVNLSTINVQLNGAVSNASNIIASNLYVTYGNNTTQVITTPTTNAGNNTFSISYTLPAGQTIPVNVYADIANTATGTGNVTMQITGTTASSGVTATTGGIVNSTIAGQNITFTPGTLNATFGNVPSNNEVVAGGQQILAARYKFTAANDSYTITEMKVQVPSIGATANSDVIQDAVLTNDSTGATLATQPFNTTGAQANDTVYFTGLNIPVPANSTMYVDVNFLLSTPNSTFATDQLNVQPTLTYVKALSSNGSVKSGTNLSSTNGVTVVTAAGTNTYVYKSVPTFTSQTINSVTASSGTNPELYKFTIAAGSQGSVSFQQLKFNLSVTHGGASSTPSVDYFTLSRDGTDITNTVTIMNASGTSLTGSTSLTQGSNQAVIVRFNNEEVIAAGQNHVYSLRATVNSFLPSQSGNDSVSVALSAGNDTAANFATHASAGTSYVEKSSSGIEQLVTKAGASAADADIIWSDMSANLHTDDAAGTLVGGTASSTGDWSTGYLLPGLPLYSSSVSAQ